LIKLVAIPGRTGKTFHNSGSRKNYRNTNRPGKPVWRNTIYFSIGIFNAGKPRAFEYPYVFDGEGDWCEVDEFHSNRRPSPFPKRNTGRNKGNDSYDHG
jgi:hypothetical protein